MHCLQHIHLYHHHLLFLYCFQGHEILRCDLCIRSHWFHRHINLRRQFEYCQNKHLRCLCDYRRQHQHLHFLWCKYPCHANRRHYLRIHWFLPVWFEFAPALYFLSSVSFLLCLLWKRTTYRCRHPNLGRIPLMGTTWLKVIILFFSLLYLLFQKCKNQII